MHIRKSKPADTQAIFELYGLPHVTPFMRAPKESAGIERAMSDVDALSVVMEVDGAIVAHGLAKNVAANWGIAELSQLLVSQPRRGYGRELVRWAQQQIFEERSAHRLYLEVVAHNHGARKLYEACGFTLEGVFRHGFPADDGTYHDLAAYGMLRTEYVHR